jgi:selenocysteine-specific elongation factor
VELPGGSWTALLRLDARIVVAVGDRFVLRDPSPGRVVAGGVVLDPLPPRGPARRRITPPRLEALAAAVREGGAPSVSAASVDLHGVLPSRRAAAIRNVLEGLGGDRTGESGAIQPPDGARRATEAQAGEPPAGEPTARQRAVDGHVAGEFESAGLMATDLAADVEAAALAAVAAHHQAAPLSPGLPVAELRPGLAAMIRRNSGLSEREAAVLAGTVLGRLVTAGRLVRDGDRIRESSRSGLPAELLEAMDRLEQLLSTAAPLGLSEAARAAACPPDGLRALESGGRIVRLEADLAYATPAYQRLADQALAMARRGSLTPAAFRDATGTSRRYVLAIIEDLDRRGVLRRTPDGHVPGTKAPPA